MEAQSGTDRGASLVGVLVVLVILGALAALAVAALPKDPSGTTDPTAALGGTASSQGGASRPAPPGAGAAAASCKANVETVKTAAATKHAADGIFPATVADLVAGRWLDEAPALRGYQLTFEVAAGRPTGKVLVNGLPADQGCAGPPRAGP